MFVTSTFKVGVSQRVVATLVACALVLTSVGYYNYAHAANLNDISNTLSNSDPSAISSHTILFTVPTGSSIAGTDEITVEFDSRDDGNDGQDFNGVATIADNTNLTVSVDSNAPTAPTFESADADTFVISGVTAAAGETVEIVVATGAGLTNPATAGSYEILVSINNSNADTGRARVFIIDNVNVTAAVYTSFDFEIRPVLASVSVNGENTTIASATTSIPFGELTPGTPEFIAQQLSVNTNARNGFTVSVEKSGEIESSTGADINTFSDGTDETTPTAWASPSNTLGSEDTYGHWGVTTEDGTVHSTGAPNFSNNDQFIAVLNTPQVIFGHDSVCDGVETGGGNASDDDACLTEVGYKIQITTLQEAGDDYATTLTYIATPRF